MSSIVAGALVATSLGLASPSAIAAVPPVFSKLPSETGEQRYAPVAATLPDGNVLIAGGANVSGYLKTAELFNASTRTFQKLEGATHELQEGRREADAVTLPGGSVIIVGGYNSNGPLNTAELFNPATNTFELLKSELGQQRQAPGVALLHDGMVLITDGCIKTCPKTAELYDPKSQTFSPVASTPIEERYYPGAATLPDGNVLIAGGYPQIGAAVKTAELFNAKTSKFEKLEGFGREMSEARGEIAGVTLQDGNLLFVGGLNSPTYLQSAELFNSLTGVFEAAKSELLEQREAPAVAVLADGKVLVADGLQNAGYAKTAELSSVNPPSRARTGRATGRTTHRARINAVVESEAVGTVYFQYGTRRRYRHRSRMERLRASQSPIAVSALLTRLTPGRRYHYRVVVENAGGRVFGTDRTFVVPKHR